MVIPDRRESWASHYVTETPRFQRRCQPLD
jgi:hypothetical protein